MSQGDEIGDPLDCAFSPCCSDAGSFPNSPCSDSSLFSLEIVMDETLAKLMKEEISQAAPDVSRRKKRGRKPLRPNDPVKKKTEEKDKYWLRAFRGYMKTHYKSILSTCTQQDNEFWLEFLGINGKPEKGRTYLSYGKRYKNHLFSHLTFIQHFKDWFYQHGYEELCKKCNPGSPLWVVFYNYAIEELVNYLPKGCSSQNGRSSPFMAEDNLIDVDDFCMIMEDEPITDQFFNSQ